MLDGKVAEGDNDMQCVKPKYETKLAARSGSAGKSLGRTRQTSVVMRTSRLAYLLRESFSGMMTVVSLTQFKKLVTS
jgi:hypothetical protein